MILYFADRGFNVLGLAGDKIKRGYNIVNDEEEIDVENGVATFSFDIFYSDEIRSDIEKLVYVGNYVLRKDGNEFKAYTIIDTDQSTENRTINVRAEDMGLDLINDIALPFNYETADYDANVDHAAEGNAANKGYINENGAYVADNNYRATNHMGLGTTPPEAWLFRVTKSEVGTKRYSVAFYDNNKTFIPGSGKYYYLSDSEQISRIETPAGAKYVRISFHVDITSAYFVASSVKSYPITTYVENCVSNSGFEIGLNEIGDVRLPLEFDDTQTCSERLNEVVSSFGAELGFSFEFKNLVISKKMVNLYSHRGADNRVELRMGRDVKNIRISRSVADLATAIIAIGKTVDDEGEEVLFTLDGYSGTIESGYYIEGSKLCSQKAYSKWSRYLSASGKRSGHIVKNFEYECGSQQTLYEYALADLKAIEDASVTYEVELFTLPPYVGLGDTVYVVDDLGEIYISARVLSIRRSEINDTISVELGEFVTKTSGLVDEWSIFRQRFAAWSAANAPRYVWVAYADDKSGTGISLDPTGKNWMGIADDRKSKEVDLSDPTVFNWIQLTAKDGKDGAGVRSTTVTYAVSTGPNVMPGDSDWQNTLPSVDKGKCLWTRTVTDYTDDSIPDTITYTYAIQGADGQNGQPGQNGVSVEVSSIEYVSWPTEQTPPDTASWSTTIPMVLPGDFLWTRTTFSDGKKAYGKARQGKDGKSPEVEVTKNDDTVTIKVTNADGSTYTKTVKDGTNGTPGTPGTDGKPSYIHIAWANSADGSTDFSTSVSENKKYLGTYSDQTQADSTDPTKYSWSLIKGADGQDGVSITSVVNRYLATNASSGVTRSTSGWTTSIQTMTADKPYLWNYETINYSSGNPTYTDPVIIGRFGTDGLPGSNGRGISSIVEHYQISNSNDTAPTSWSDTMIATTSAKPYLWNYETVNYTDGTHEDSTKRVIGTHGYSPTATVTKSGNTVTISITDSTGVTTETVLDGSDGIDGSQFWTATAAPTTPNYTFAKNKLTGDGNADIKVGDIVLYSYYRYTVTSVGDTTVLTGSRTSLRGANGRVYDLNISDSAIIKNQDGTYEPSTISVSSTYHDGTANPATYAGRFKIETSTDGSTWAADYTSSANESSNTYTVPSSIRMLRISLYLAGGTTTLLDQQTVPIISDGIDGISPTATVTKNGDTTTITITDKNGTTTKTVKDGTNGQPGAPGTNGLTAYFHVKYSNDGGSTFTGNSGEDVGSWIGTYTDNTEADSTSVAAYQWVKIEGADGEDGKDAYTVILTNESHTFSATSDGKAVANQTAECQIIAYKGTTQVAAKIGTISGQPTGLTTTISNNETTTAKFTAKTAATLATKSGVLTVPITVDGKSFSKRFTYSLAVAGTDGKNPTVTKSGSTVTITDGDGHSVTVTDGKNGVSPTVSKSGDTVTIVDAQGNTVTVKDGENGQSIKGDKGDDAYLHIAWATNATGTAGFSTTDATGKTYMGTYTDTISDDSQDPTKYDWVKIKGETGASAIGLGWRVNASNFTNTNGGECYFHGYDDDGNPADVDGWIMWNGAKIEIPKGMWINPNKILPYNTVLLHVCRITIEEQMVSVVHADVFWQENTGKWRGSIYSSSGSPAALADWTWKEETDAIIATYVEPGSDAKILSAQLFNPPKKYSELPDPSVLYSLNAYKTDADGRITNAQTAADNAASAASAAQATADAASVEYIVGTQTAATGTWRGVTRDAELVAGKTIAYKLPYDGSGNASLNLTLSGGGTTGNKAVYLNTTRVTTHFGAHAVIQMTYDGTYWRVTSIPNSNNYDRTLHNNYILPLEAIAAGKLICGTEAGYKAVAANVQFDISYPILLTTDAMKANTKDTAYEVYPGVNITTTGAVEDLEVDKTVWLKVQHLGGSKFAVAAENFLTCVVPTDVTSFYYIPLGLVSHDSTAKTFFVTSDRLYGFINGEFQPLDTAAVLESRSLRTEFMTYSSTNDGIVAGIRSDLTTVENKSSELANDISDTKQLVETVRSELATITKDDTGYLALVTQRIDALTNRVEKAEGYMTAEGWVVEDSNNKNTKTIMTGDGLKVVSNETGNSDVYLEVNSVNSTIHNTTITGYANIAGFSLDKKEETEYDGTATLGIAFNS